MLTHGFSLASRILTKGVILVLTDKPIVSPREGFFSKAIVVGTDGVYRLGDNVKIKRGKRYAAGSSNYQEGSEHEDEEEY